MNFYEGMFLVDNSEAKKNYDAVSDNVSNIIGKYGGKVISSENWGERRLAYTIKRRDRGTYILVYFEAPPESIVEIRRDCVIDEVILRNMILRIKNLPEKEQEPEVQAEKQSGEEPGKEEVSEKKEPSETRAEAEPAAEGEEESGGEAPEETETEGAQAPVESGEAAAQEDEVKESN